MPMYSGSDETVDRDPVLRCEGRRDSGTRRRWC